MFYSGKSQCLGMKASPAVVGASMSSAVMDWKELAIVKSPKIVQCSVGHDGQHCLLVADDGSVFFVGVARRGEDGDSSGSLCEFCYNRQTCLLDSTQLALLDQLDLCVSSAITDRPVH